MQQNFCPELYVSMPGDTFYLNKFHFLKNAWNAFLQKMTIAFEQVSSKPAENLPAQWFSGWHTCL